MRDIEQLIREVNGTMAIEGMPLTDEDKSKMREVLRGEISFEAMRTRILTEYRPKRLAYE